VRLIGTAVSANRTKADSQEGVFLGKKQLSDKEGPTTKPARDVNIELQRKTENGTGELWQRIESS